MYLQALKKIGRSLFLMYVGVSSSNFASMAHFELIFDLATGELTETRFQRDVGEPPLVCVRGRPLTTPSGVTGSFQWSPALRALCSLVLRHYLHGNNVLSAQESCIRGGKGSPAASLDYALSKQPTWLHDLFGSCPRGNTRARSIIQRINPERKKGGEVRLHIHNTLLPAASVRIRADGDQELGHEQLITLLRSLEVNELKQRAATHQLLIEAMSYQRAEPPIPPGMDAYAYLQHLLVSWLEEEVTASIFETDVFTKQAESAVIRQICKDPIVSRLIAKHGMSFSAFLGSSDPHSIPFANEIRALLAQTPIKIQMCGTIAQVSTILLFLVIRKLFHVEVQVSVDAPYTAALIRGGVVPQSDGKVVVFPLALGATIEALRVAEGSGWSPISIAPGVSYDLLAKQFDPSHGLRSDMYVFQDDLYTSSFIYMTKLISSGAVKASAMKITSAAPHEALEAMIQRRDRCGAVLWFPHNRVNRILTGSQRLLGFRKAFGIAESFLFANTDSDQQARLLRSLVRYAWLQLRINPALRREVIAELMTTSDYFHTFLTYTGLHSHLATLMRGDYFSLQPETAGRTLLRG